MRVKDPSDRYNFFLPLGTWVTLRIRLLVYTLTSHERYDFFYLVRKLAENPLTSLLEKILSY